MHADTALSSCGVLERYFHRSYTGPQIHVEVEDLNVGNDILNSENNRASLAILYTFRDKLHLMYDFNEASEEPASVQAYLEDVKKVLCDQMAGR